MESHRYNTRSQAVRRRILNDDCNQRRRSQSAARQRGATQSHLLRLPVDLVLSICSYVPPNDVACSIRICCKTLHDALSAPQHRIVRLSAPVQPHAFDWALRHGIAFSDPDRSGGQGARALDGLTYEEKIRMSELVAGTGVLSNLVKLHRVTHCPGNCSTPRAAAAGGHLHVLQWLQSESSCLACVRVQQAIGSAASLPVLQWYESCMDAHAPTLFAAACDDDVADRRQAKLQYLYDKHGLDVLSRQATGAAARRGDLATLIWLKKRGAAVDATTLIAAAAGGDIDVAAWVAANGGGGGVSLAALYEASLEGHLAMMRWLLEHQRLSVPPLRWRRMLMAAARGGHVAAVQWLLSEQRVEADQEVLCLAAEGGHCEVMRLLLRHGRRPSPEAFGRAVKSGRIDAMQLLLEADAAAAAAPRTAAAAVNGSPRQASPAAAAAIPAHPAVAGIMHPLAYVAAALSVQETPPPPRTTMATTATAPAAAAAAAASTCGRNSVEVLGWLELQGCSAGTSEEREEAVAAAALTGSRARVEWLRSRGFGWSDRTFAAAAASGCVRLVEWMSTEGCPMGRRGDALLAAAANADADMLAALRRLGCPWAANVLPRAVHGVLQLGGSGGGHGVSGSGPVRVVRCRLEVLRWMVEHGCPVTKQAYEVAKMFHRQDVADWLKRSGMLH